LEQQLSEGLSRAAALLCQAKRPVALTGAGVSAESGVPTFRGAGGLWEKYRVEEVATPEAFQRNPRFVWEFYNLRRAALMEASPNPAHKALAELEQIYPDFVLITQNVDRLHQRAGSKRVIELHGNLWEARCTRCSRVEDKTGLVLPELPSCSWCGGLMRPAVVWFGEPLPMDAWRAAEEAIDQTDLLLVVGTSATVHPAASLIWRARAIGQATIVEVNIQPSEAAGVVDIFLQGRAGEILPRLLACVRPEAGQNGYALAE
jgi:NAD-dependent deacetylase